MMITYWKEAGVAYLKTVTNRGRLRSAAAGGIATWVSECCLSAALPVLISKYNPDTLNAQISPVGSQCSTSLPAEGKAVGNYRALKFSV
jgi:hypothetical protein